MRGNDPLDLSAQSCAGRRWAHGETETAVVQRTVYIPSSIRGARLTADEEYQACKQGLTIYHLPSCLQNRMKQPDLYKSVRQG